MYNRSMDHQPRVHLGSLLRSGEDVCVSGELNSLKYQQDHTTHTLAFTKPAAYEVTIQRLGWDEMYLQAEFSPTIVMECARCLCDVTVPLQLKLSTMMRYQPSSKKPYLDEDESGTEILVVGTPDLDLSDYFAENTLLGMPLSVLHAPDCKGLCQKCGQDLNDPKADDSDCIHTAPVPIEAIDDQLGIPQGSLHAKQNPFAVLEKLDLPD